MEELNQALKQINDYIALLGRAGMQTSRSENFMILGAQSARNMVEAQLWKKLHPDLQVTSQDCFDWAMHGRTTGNYL